MTVTWPMGHIVLRLVRKAIEVRKGQVKVYLRNSVPNQGHDIQHLNNALSLLVDCQIGCYLANPAVRLRSTGLPA